MSAGWQWSHAIHPLYSPYLPPMYFHPTGSVPWIYPGGNGHGFPMPVSGAPAAPAAAAAVGSYQDEGGADANVMMPEGAQQSSNKPPRRLFHCICGCPDCVEVSRERYSILGEGTPLSVPKDVLEEMVAKLFQQGCNTKGYQRSLIAIDHFSMDVRRYLWKKTAKFVDKSKFYDGDGNLLLPTMSIEERRHELSLLRRLVAGNPERVGEIVDAVIGRDDQMMNLQQLTDIVDKEDGKVVQGEGGTVDETSPGEEAGGTDGHSLAELGERGQGGTVEGTNAGEEAGGMDGYSLAEIGDTDVAELGDIAVATADVPSETERRMTPPPILGPQLTDAFLGRAKKQKLLSMCDIKEGYGMLKDLLPSDDVPLESSPLPEQVEILMPRSCYSTRRGVLEEDFAKMPQWLRIVVDLEPEMLMRTLIPINHAFPIQRGPNCTWKWSVSKILREGGWEEYLESKEKLTILDNTNIGSDKKVYCNGKEIVNWDGVFYCKDIHGSKLFVDTKKTLSLGKQANVYLFYYLVEDHLSAELVNMVIDDCGKYRPNLVPFALLNLMRFKHNVKKKNGEEEEFLGDIETEFAKPECIAAKKNAELQAKHVMEAFWNHVHRLFLKDMNRIPWGCWCQLLESGDAVFDDAGKRAREATRATVTSGLSPEDAKNKLESLMLLGYGRIMAHSQNRYVFRIGLCERLSAFRPTFSVLFFISSDDGRTKRVSEQLYTGIGDNDIMMRLFLERDYHEVFEAMTKMLYGGLHGDTALAHLNMLFVSRYLYNNSLPMDSSFKGLHQVNDKKWLITRNEVVRYLENPTFLGTGADEHVIKFLKFFAPEYFWETDGGPRKFALMLCKRIDPSIGWWLNEIVASLGQLMGGEPRLREIGLDVYKDLVTAHPGIHDDFADVMVGAPGWSKSVRGEVEEENVEEDEEPLSRLRKRRKID